jgi:hypothetical protein
MLSQDTKDKFQGLGFDVSKLIEAVKAEEEVSLDVPTLYKNQGITEDQKNLFGQNRFEEGKNAMSEIKAKEFKAKYGIELEGKNLDSVVEKIIETKVQENSGDPDKRVNILTQEKEALQGNIITLQDQLRTKESEFQNKLFNLGVREQIKAIIPSEGMKIGNNDLTTLFLTSHRVTKDESGRTVIQKGDEVLKDQATLEPLPLKSVVNTFIDQGQYKIKNGMGGDDLGSGGSNIPKFKNAGEFMTWAKANNMQPMSQEAQKILSENKAEDYQRNN